MNMPITAGRIEVVDKGLGVREWDGQIKNMVDIISGKIHTESNKIHVNKSYYIGK